MTRLIVDVREPSEFSSGHVSGAVNIPPAEIMAGSPQLAAVTKETEIVLYCVSGSRSNVATNILKAQGFSNLVNGINAQQVAAKYDLAITTD
jgi:rhodanese-related sulfurtransferase